MEMLRITAKGEEELKHRTYRLDSRKRSLLILLVKPRPIADLQQKTVLPAGDFYSEIGALIDQGFVISGDASRPAAASTPSRDGRSALATESTVHSSHSAGNVDQVLSPDDIHIEDGIILSEAKFLLTDYCVDCFGTSSEVFLEEIRACHNVAAFRACFSRIVMQSAQHCPASAYRLRELAIEINGTA
ncbi:MAG: hypothetical protein PHI49_11830 [Halothiobacillaceae bacterium]|jgi:hypothetical protein|nr:hypothetical protein [Halothiobacillaceae bacterium]MDY0050375.1 hypothetical protein [Halothiobacillaceae bacterium]